MPCSAMPATEPQTGRVQPLLDLCLPVCIVTDSTEQAAGPIWQSALGREHELPATLAGLHDRPDAETSIADRLAVSPMVCR